MCVCTGLALKVATRVAASTLPPSIWMYTRELPFGSQSHFRISSLCVCARVPFVIKIVCDFAYRLTSPDRSASSARARTRMASA